MTIKPIRTETDYQQALREIEQLWDAPAGSPEADRLDVLFTLVAAYEAEHHAIQFLELGVSQPQLPGNREGEAYWRGVKKEAA